MSSRRLPPRTRSNPRLDAEVARVLTALFEEFYGDVRPDAWLLMTQSVERWRRSGNAHYMLHALVQLQKQGVTITGTLAEEMAAAAQAILEDRSLGTREQVLSEAIRESALYVMMSLRYAELTLLEAASKAAAWTLQKGGPGGSLKASYLLWYYKDKSRGPKLSNYYFPLWDKRENLKTEMIRFAESLPDALPDQEGRG